MFVHIEAYNNPRPEYSVFKTGPEYSSSKECLNNASEWIAHEIIKMDFEYDWKLAICSNGEIDIYKYPIDKKYDLSLGCLYQTVYIVDSERVPDSK